MDEAMKSTEATTYPEGLEWHWYGGDDGERYYIGPYASREQVVADINRDGLERAYIVEAAKQPVKLSAYFSADSLMYALLEDDEIADPEGYHDIEINATPAQTEELVMAVRIAIDHWQARHGIVIMPWAFTFSRNEEMIVRKSAKSKAVKVTKIDEASFPCSPASFPCRQSTSEQTLQSAETLSGSSLQISHGVHIFPEVQVEISTVPHGLAVRPLLPEDDHVLGQILSMLADEDHQP